LLLCSPRCPYPGLSLVLCCSPSTLVFPFAFSLLLSRRVHVSHGPGARSVEAKPVCSARVQGGPVLPSVTVVDSHAVPACLQLYLRFSRNFPSRFSTVCRLTLSTTHSLAAAASSFCFFCLPTSSADLSRSRTGSDECRLSLRSVPLSLHAILRHLQIPDPFRHSCFLHL